MQAYDVALAHLGIVEERFRVIGFTRPYSVEAVRFAVHKGGARSITPALVKPFKADVRFFEGPPQFVVYLQRPSIIAVNDLY